MTSVRYLPNNGQSNDRYRCTGRASKWLNWMWLRTGTVFGHQDIKEYAEGETAPYIDNKGEMGGFEGRLQ